MPVTATPNAFEPTAAGLTRAVESRPWIAGGFMVNAVLLIIILLGVAFLLLRREANKTRVESYLSSGCGLFLVLVLLVLAGVVYYGARHGW
jgi:fumarate reductase subunit D